MPLLNLWKSQPSLLVRGWRRVKKSEPKEADVEEADFRMQVKEIEMKYGG